MKVVLTGAAGLTGAAVLRAILARGHEIVAVVRREPERIPEDEHIRVALADCTDVAAMGELIQGADALVHVAGIHLGKRLAAIPATKSLSSTLVVSTASVYSQYRAQAGFYRQNENALLEAFPKVTIVRPTMIYGSRRDRNVHHVIEFAARYRLLPLFGDSEALIQPIHYDDLAQGIAALLHGNSSAYLDAGGPKPMTVRAAGEIIFGAMGMRPHFVRIPFRPAIFAGGIVDRVRGSRIAERLERFREDRSVDVRQFTEVTGIEPRSFDLGIRAEVEEVLGR